MSWVQFLIENEDEKRQKKSDDGEGEGAMELDPNTLLNAAPLVRIKIAITLLKANGFRSVLNLCQANKELYASICGSSEFWVACIEHHFGFDSYVVENNPYRSEWCNRAARDFLAILRSGKFASPGRNPERAAKEARQVFYALQQPIKFPYKWDVKSTTVNDGAVVRVWDYRLEITPILHALFEDLAQEDTVTKPIFLELPNRDIKFVRSEPGAPFVVLRLDDDTQRVAQIEELADRGLASLTKFEEPAALHDINNNWMLTTDNVTGTVTIFVVSRKSGQSYPVRETVAYSELCFEGPKLASIFIQEKRGKSYSIVLESASLIADGTVTFETSDVDLPRPEKQILILDTWERKVVATGEGDSVFDGNAFVSRPTSINFSGPSVQHSQFTARVQSSYDGDGKMVVFEFLLMQQLPDKTTDEYLPPSLFISHALDSNEVEVTTRIFQLGKRALLVPFDFRGLYRQTKRPPQLKIEFA